MEFSRTKFSDSSLRRYLLGLCDEAERTEIEEAFLTDKLSEQYLSLVEDELIEDYVDGSLEPANVKYCDEFFLNNSDRRAKLFVISSLRKSSQDFDFDSRIVPDTKNVVGTDRRRLVLVSITFVCAALIGQVALLGIRVISLKKELETATSERNLALNEQAQSAPSGTPSDTSEMLHLRLVPGGTRGTGLMNRLHVVTTTRTIVLEVPIGSTSFRDYRISLRTQDDEEVWSESLLRSDKEGFVSVFIPVQSVAIGDYEVRLSGKSSPNGYQVVMSCPLRVTK